MESDERKIGTVMRGVAITGIVMHNFLHKSGFSLENESTFDYSRSIGFLSESFNSSLAHSAGNLISFIGWIGVCVFVFLSGYGVECKYGSSEVDNREFVSGRWLKLAKLMSVGVLAFIIIKWNSGAGLKYLLSLSMAGNLLRGYELPCGVYWYFGLCFELYILWLAIRHLDVRWVVVIALGFVAVQVAALYGSLEVCYYVKHNFYGWGHLFIVGMLVARTRTLKNVRIGWLTSLFGFIFSIALVVALNFNALAWLLLLPFVSVIAVWTLAELILKWSVSERIGLWLGGMSAFLFAMHPLVREIVLGNAFDSMNIGLKFAFYLLCTLLLSIACKQLSKKIPSI